MELSAASGDPAVLRVAGEVDLATAEQLRTRLVELVTDGRPRLMVDLSAVSFCDASGLSAFVAGLERAREHGGWVRLCGLQPMVAKVFRITALDQEFAVYPTLAQDVGGDGSTARLSVDGQGAVQTAGF